MKHGDISNTRGFVIGVRCEECLLMSKDNNIIDKAVMLIEKKYLL